MTYNYITIDIKAVTDEFEDTMTYPFIGIYEDKVSPENMPEIYMPSQADVRKVLVYVIVKDSFTTFAETSWINPPSLYETEEEFFNAVKEIKLESLL